jgi:hypothetical protein
LGFLAQHWVGIDHLLVKFLGQLTREIIPHIVKE